MDITCSRSLGPRLQCRLQGGTELCRVSPMWGLVEVTSAPVGLGLGSSGGSLGQLSTWVGIRRVIDP